MARLLIEDVSFIKTPQDIIHQIREKNNGQLIVPTKLQEGNLKNQNGRIYPLELLKREDTKFQIKIKEDRAFGELDHPDEAQVLLARTSHRIVETRFDGAVLNGKLLVLEKLPYGLILNNLLESGSTVGSSSRAVGTTKRTNEGAELVQEDLLMVTYDVVGDPSTRNAFLALKEGKEIDLNQYPTLLAAHIDNILDDIINLERNLREAKNNAKS